MKELEYPFDTEYIIKNKKKIKKELLKRENLIEKKIAILGGSTSSEVKNMLDIFLLNFGIKCEFYESEYNKYYEDAMFGNKILDEFKPDIVYIHTTNKNIISYPTILNTYEDIDVMLNDEYTKYKNMWDELQKKYNCIIIQNDFECLYYSLLGNKDVSNFHGRNNYILRLNQKFYQYANENSNFFINSINYISSCYGLDRWSNQFYWYMYKYAMEVPAIPYLAFNVAKIIKSIYGKNKKALVLDLDNTLWGGIVGDDGVENLSIGPETPNGQVYFEFQQYLKEHQNLGIILNINSKNEYENAIAGLNHPNSILKPEDFTIIKANWNPKNINIKQIAEELNIGEDSFVFVDDNPAERHIVFENIEGVSVPNIHSPEDYIRIIDHNGYFELTNFSIEDTKRVADYKKNIERKQLMSKFENYNDYLKSLKMVAKIGVFESIYLERISQLSNKSNQFNLTTKRYSVANINEIYNNNEYIKIYGKLEDVFGDNGLVSVVIGKIKNQCLHIDLWIMSCRVLKRDMEYAMMDELVNIAKSRNINKIYGYYYPTKKNNMVSNFYDLHGFILLSCDKLGNKKYELEVKKYKKKNKVIEVKK